MVGPFQTNGLVATSPTCTGRSRSTTISSANAWIIRSGPGSNPCPNGSSRDHPGPATTGPPDLERHGGQRLVGQLVEQPVQARHQRRPGAADLAGAAHLGAGAIQLDTLEGIVRERLDVEVARCRSGPRVLHQRGQLVPVEPAGEATGHAGVGRPPHREAAVLGDVQVLVVGGRHPPPEAPQPGDQRAIAFHVPPRACWMISTNSITWRGCTPWSCGSGCRDGSPMSEPLVYVNTWMVSYLGIGPPAGSSGRLTSRSSTRSAPLNRAPYSWTTLWAKAPSLMPWLVTELNAWALDLVRTAVRCSMATRSALAPSVAAAAAT